MCHQFVCPAEHGRCPATDLGQTVDNSERILLTSKGERRSIIKTVRPVVMGGGHHYLLESFLDITERKRGNDHSTRGQDRQRCSGDFQRTRSDVHGNLQTEEPSR